MGIAASAPSNDQKGESALMNQGATQFESLVHDVPREDGSRSSMMNAKIDVMIKCVTLRVV